MLAQPFAAGVFHRYSGDRGCTASMLAGADAFYSVAAGTWPAQMLRLVRPAQSGDATETARVDAAFQPLWSLFPQFGSIRVVHRTANLRGCLIPTRHTVAYRLPIALAAARTAPNREGAFS